MPVIFSVRLTPLQLGHQSLYLDIGAAFIGGHTSVCRRTNVKRLCMAGLWAGTRSVGPWANRARQIGREEQGGLGKGEGKRSDRRMNRISAIQARQHH